MAEKFVFICSDVKPSLITEREREGGEREEREFVKVTQITKT